ncbi:YveK family protein [Paenibacillus gorillae]|uniref:YveK family protein n=1 Tax=Paenibacillus gorillae TaxID=1243662 RepID=UPI0004B71933|nr:Wzz/FepE/Etk N-terminal domain-containing protein [Paenibacillus gorillae]
MDLNRYLSLVKKKWWLLAIFVIVACAAVAVKSLYFTTPIYEARAKLIVNQVNSNLMPNVGSLQFDLMLMGSYKEIMLSSAILDKVVELYPELGESASHMARELSVASSTNSQVMSIVYQDESYQHAMDVVNAVVKVFKDQIPTIMNVNNITILNEAKSTDANSLSPINNNMVMSLLIAFVISIMLCMSFIIFLDYLNDTFKSEVELKELLGIPVLASLSKTQRKDLRTGRRKAALAKKREVGENYATLNQ